METVEYIELFWDCPECGHRHISAVFNSQGNRCPNCLHWRTEDVELYEAPDSQIITDSNLINRKPFWVCKVCEAVNEDTGVPATVLQCGNCDSYQTSSIGAITGNQAADQQAPATVAIGEPVERRSNTGQNQASTPSTPKTGRISGFAASLIGMTLIGGGFFGSSVLLSQPNDATLRQVQVTDLKWTVEVEVQEQKTFTRSGWDESVPQAAAILQSQKKQRGTRQEQKGSRTVMVDEQYQSGTRTETYSEPEQYQSGTRTETYTTSERYQSGTRSETYSDSERYQSGTRQDCKTTSKGNGVGTRTCRDVAVYSTRQIQRSRSVPVYGTRHIQHSRTVPVYSTRQVQRSRTVPVYSTRKVPVQEPIMITLPVYDTWITYRTKEWVPAHTYKQTGKAHEPRQAPTVKLVKLPPQRIAATRTTCHVAGNYSIHIGWFQPAQVQTGEWNLPCQEYDRIQIGNSIKLRQTDANSATIVRSPSLWPPFM